MFSVKVIPDHGDEYEVTATSRDVSKWEKTTKGAAMAQLRSELRMADVYKITYHAVVRQQLFAGTMAEFEDGHDLDLLDEEEVDPTQ